ncbi:endonuclease/exonuclease/phosphatase family protein, partial [bacterium]
MDKNHIALAQRAITNNQENIKIKFGKKHLKLGKLNVIYLNIISIRNKLDELEEIIHETQNLNSKIIHLIVLTEARLNDEDTKFYNLNNYTAFHCTRADGFGGVLLLVHESLTGNLIVKKSQSNVELLVVNILELSLNIIVVYKQPPVCTDTLLSILIPLIENRGKCIIIGDLNINLLSDSNTVNQYVNAFLSRGFSFLNKIEERFATRVAERLINQRSITSKTIIDHVITNCINYSYIFSLIDIPISDHKLMSIAFDDCKKSNFLAIEKTVTVNVLNERNFNANLETMFSNPLYREEFTLSEFLHDLET